MDQIKIIDVTLRDGGYRNNFDFDMGYIDAHVRSVSDTGVDIIEVGYRNGPQKQWPGIGVTGRCENSFLERLANIQSSARICVIAHPHNISTSDINDMASLGVSVLRICCSATNLDDAIPLMQHARAKDMLVCGNLTRVSEIDVHTALSISKTISAAGTHVLYLADSNGSLQPKRLRMLVESIKEYTDVDIGFHAHDHLNLAMVNSITAMESGATYFDGSLFGVGKGAGNLRLEAWLLYIKKRLGRKFDIAPLLQQATSLPHLVSPNIGENDVLDIVCAYFDISMDERKNFTQGLSDISAILSNAQKYEKLSA
jgi:4-hydroxy 2-oxovalerate aldolase